MASAETPASSLPSDLTPTLLPPTATPSAPFAGRWVPVPGVPVGAWSAALLPTGKVLLFQSGAAMYLWDPKTRQYSIGARLSAHANLFCAGLAMLGDGRLLAVGGHEGRDPQKHFLGLRSAEIFDPWQERWERIGDMAGGERWYPTAIALPDGRVLVASGTHAGKANETIEVLDAQQKEWTVLTRLRLPSYPWAAVMPWGEVLFYGPQLPVYLFDPTSVSVRRLTQRDRGRAGGAGVLLNARTGRALALGGGFPTTSTAELLYPSTSSMRYTAAMAYMRHHPNAVLLPDGRVLAVGGQREVGQREEEKADIAHAVLTTELFDLEQETWWEVGTAHYAHGYHATALLLPDGSVMAAGPQKTLEIYFPWYFTQERPRLEAAPEAVTYGQSFVAKTPDATRIAKTVLIRLSSVTHALNTDQRYLEVPFTVAPEGLAVSAPDRPALAPPGYYLLFLVTGQKVPSEGKMLHIR